MPGSQSNLGWKVTVNKHRQLQELIGYEIKTRSELDQMWRNAEEHIEAINMLLEMYPKSESVLRGFLTLVVLQLRLNRLARQLDEM